MIDLLAAAADSPLYNFHSHTQFCDGHATMAEFAQAAVEAGFRHYGFSPHSPIPIESPCNMAWTDVPAYLAEVERLKTLYQSSSTRFYASMEIDYLGHEWGPHVDEFQRLPLDYRIGSVHFIPGQEGMLIDIDGRFESFRRKMADHFHGDIRYVVDTFFAHSLDMLEHGGFDIIGHFDKIGHNASHYQPGIEQEPWYKRHMERIIEAIAASGVIVEINTKARADHGRFFPDPAYWSTLKRAGIPMIINSDAHRPTLINASRPEALSLLHSL